MVLSVVGFVQEGTLKAGQLDQPCVWKNPLNDRDQPHELLAGLVLGKLLGHRTPILAAVNLGNNFWSGILNPGEVLWQNNPGGQLGQLDRVPKGWGDT